jgi:hypothetical protein
VSRSIAGTCLERHAADDNIYLASSVGVDVFADNIPTPVLTAELAYKIIINSLIDKEQFAACQWSFG